MEIDIPAPPNVDTRRKPSEEQLAQVLERTPMVEPEKKDVAFNFIPLECLSTKIFILTTIPNRIAVIFDKIKPVIASSGR